MGPQTAVRRLTLMRHAEAAPAPAGADDRDRPLTNIGCRQARALGQRFASDALAPDQILASDAERTLATARSFLGGAALRRPLCLLPDLYGCASDMVFDLIAEFANPLAAHVLVLGHNPAIAEAAMQLAGPSAGTHSAIREFDPGSCATFAICSDGWTQLRRAAVRMERVIHPNG